MAVIAYPGSPKHQSVSLTPFVSALANASNLTGARQALDVGYSWWSADISVAPMRYSDARKWRLFFGRVRGQVNAFRLPITGGPQHGLSFTAHAQGTTSSGYSVPSDGWPLSSTPLLAGDYVTVGDQLMVLDDDVVANSIGEATLRFHSPLRGTVVDNTTIETKRPFMRAYLPEGAPALTLTAAQLQAGFSFTAMEAY